MPIASTHDERHPQEIVSCMEFPTLAVAPESGLRRSWYSMTFEDESEAEGSPCVRLVGHSSMMHAQLPAMADDAQQPRCSAQSETISENSTEVGSDDEEEDGRKLHLDDSDAEGEPGLAIRSSRSSSFVSSPELSPSQLRDDCMPAREQATKEEEDDEEAIKLRRLEKRQRQRQQRTLERRLERGSKSASCSDGKN